MNEQELKYENLHDVDNRIPQDMSYVILCLLAFILKILATLICPEAFISE